MSLFDHNIVIERSTFYIVRPKLMITIINFTGFKDCIFNIMLVFGYEKRRLWLVSWMSKK